jgi:hypothetical protein
MLRVAFGLPAPGTTIDHRFITLLIRAAKQQLTYRTCLN